MNLWNITFDVSGQLLLLLLVRRMCITCYNFPAKKQQQKHGAYILAINGSVMLYRPRTSQERSLLNLWFNRFEFQGTSEIVADLTKYIIVAGNIHKQQPPHYFLSLVKIRDQVSVVFTLFIASPFTVRSPAKCLKSTAVMETELGTTPLMLHSSYIVKNTTRFRYVQFKAVWTKLLAYGGILAVLG